MLSSLATAQLARVALANVDAEYPFLLAHFAQSDADLRPPRLLHPAFHGSYDWHSAVHMHWSLVRCARLLDAVPAAPADGPATETLRASIGAHLARRLTRVHIAAECDYFNAPGRASFERPYGWAWLLALSAELHAAADAATAPLPQAAMANAHAALLPLANLIEDRLLAFLDRADYPVRAGTHGNSAFALLLARHYAERLGRTVLLGAINQRARAWFVNDRRWPARYEPGGDDFLSSGLTEAALMAQVLGAHFPSWWEEFAPVEPARWLDPAAVSDPSDAKIVHLHGLNLSRAWCWRLLEPRLDRSWRSTAAEAAERHVDASRHAALVGDYVGTHWLASFLLLATTGLDLRA